ncbi:MAG: thiol:disulfide interchange protein DsbA/DsbL [Pseudoxanthomonas sp.]
MRFRFALLLSALLPFAAAASADAPVEGQDYEVIANGQPFAPSLDGKVEVAEVFSYGCIHCAHFQPLVDEWKKKQPAWIRFTPVPAPLSSAWLPYARAYYAAQNLGVLARTHAAVFKALHETGSLPRQNPSAGELATFYADYGVKPDAFVKEFSGARVDAQLKQAEAFVMRSEAFTTPMLIVNGKYRVLGRSFEDTLRIADALARREHGGAP